MLLIINFLENSEALPLNKVITRDKVCLTEKDKIIKTDKKTADCLNEVFSSIAQNLDIKRYEIGSDSVVNNTTDPTLKAILKYRKHLSIIAINDRYKGNDTLNFNEVHETEIKNQILQLNKRIATQGYDIPNRVIIENADIFSDILCNNFNNSIVSSNFPQCLKLADITPSHKKGKKL